ncbi:MAG: hypothetical protein LR011_03475, partial [Verrucomicrobia bacterium]|nr:hypothetical protein [Verrucomicrobiota bacterium]
MKSITRILTALLLLSQWKTLEAALLFEADFSVGKPGWTSVQPDYATQWLAGPLRWVFDTQRNLVSENSNIYSDDANASPSTAAAMFINDRDSGLDFTYSASIKPGDDDGAGLIFGYVDSANFFRISFGIQSRTGFPYTGWSLDQVKGGKPLVLAGHDGTNTIDPAFIPTRGQAFQVEIKVSSGTSLSISLTDAIGSATPSLPIQIVNALALPESAAGKVGFFTWGQSGGNPPGVEFSNWSMEPNGMAAPDSNPLSAWQSVLPANATGVSAPSPGTWGLGFGSNGPSGSLSENSNSFLNATSIEGNSHIDFSAPTYVAGETSWTDYTVSARIIPSDDDGHGLVLRYLDENNFYRISLAGQADADGRPWQGLSVQKKVQGAWSQVFHDASRSFIPANNVPYDIVAQIQGNRLDIRIINDPNGSATPYLFDPIQISGSSVDQGKVGFFSWGMNATEVDFIRVESSILLSENFNDSIAGWNIVIPPVFQSLQPGPLRWIQDLNTSGFAENSNFYTDSATFSPTTVPAIIINEALVTGAYTWKATLNSGDNDGYGVIFGYKDPLNFYRVTFAIQDRPDGYPWYGWSFDRFVDGKSEILAGDNGSSEFIPDFVQTATRAFRVIVQVDDQSNLTLDVLDDAASEFPIEIRLIDGLKLPVQPDGQVGIMVWGQSGGGNPPGALFTDFELSPFQLVNNPVRSLDGWISELPDNNVNEAPTFPGYWGLAFNQELGMWGTLNESSNAFLNATDVNGNTHVDFTAPTLVTGDASWTDYIVRTRLIPSDDDGHGILFRYQDAENFYRLSFAGQADADGRPWQGVSVQKKVNGVWSEVFHDETGSFIPANNVPFDVLLTVNGDAADLTISRDVNGQMETISFGPFEFSGDKIDAGKVGFFSWGMNAFAADFLQVQEIEGIPLQVNSEFGTPVPPVGLTSFDSGMAVEAMVEAVVNESESVRHVNIGYTGSGNVPASGATSSVSFSINRFSVLTWNWVSEYKVSVRASQGGIGNRSRPGLCPGRRNRDDP